MKSNGLITFIVFLVLGTGFSVSPAPAKSSRPDPTVLHLVDEFITQTRDKQELMVGDLIKKATSPDPELLEHVKDVFVMDLPQPGEKQRLSKHFIFNALRKAGLNNVYKNIHIESESIIPVYGPGHRVTVEEAVRLLQKHLLNQADWTKETLVMHVTKAPSQDAWLPSQNFDVFINKMQDQVLGDNRYTVEFYIDNIMAESLEFLVSVKRKYTVYLPKRSIQRGEVITPGDLRQTAMFIDNDMINERLVKKAEAIIGQRARRSIKPGEPIQWNMLETNYVVRRGDLVRVILKQGGLILQTNGYVQKRAALGDVVPIKTINTGKIITGKVISQDLVEML